MSQYLVVRRFNFTKSYLAFAGFASFSLEACVGKSGLAASVYLSAIAYTKRYVVTGIRAWKARCRTLLVRVALLPLLLVRLFLMSL